MVFYYFYRKTLFYVVNKHQLFANERTGVSSLVVFYRLLTGFLT